MSYLVLYVILAGLCLVNIQFAPSGMDIKVVMNRMNKLRFIVAVILIFGHSALPHAYIPRLLLPFHKASTFAVGYFFIQSGYGLAYSVACKPNYLRKFWKKVGNLLWITVFSSVVSTLLKNIVLREWEALRLVNWYMAAIVVLYLVFYAAYMLFPKSKTARLAFLTGVVFAMMLLICWYDQVTGQNSRNYYISELAFPFGVFIYEYSDAITKFLKKKYAVLILAAAEIAFGAAALAVPEKSVLDVVFHNLMLLPFGLALIWIMDKIEINNAALRTMNRYSTFVYLFQFAVLDILKRWYVTANRPFDLLYSLGCFGLTCVLAIAIQTIYDRVGAAVRKRPQNQR